MKKIIYITLLIFLGINIVNANSINVDGSKDIYSNGNSVGQQNISGAYNVDSGDLIIDTLNNVPQGASQAELGSLLGCGNVMECNYTQNGKYIITGRYIPVNPSASYSIKIINVEKMKFIGNLFVDMNIPSSATNCYGDINSSIVIKEIGNDIALEAYYLRYKFLYGVGNPIGASISRGGLYVSGEKTFPLPFHLKGASFGQVIDTLATKINDVYYLSTDDIIGYYYGWTDHPAAIPAGNSNLVKTNAPGNPPTLYNGTVIVGQNSSLEGTSYQYPVYGSDPQTYWYFDPDTQNTPSRISNPYRRTFVVGKGDRITPIHKYGRSDYPIIGYNGLDPKTGLSVSCSVSDNESFVEHYTPFHYSTAGNCTIVNGKLYAQKQPSFLFEKNGEIYGILNGNLMKGRVDTGLTFIANLNSASNIVYNGQNNLFWAKTTNISSNSTYTAYSYNMIEGTIESKSHTVYTNYHNIIIGAITYNNSLKTVHVSATYWRRYESNVSANFIFSNIN